MFKAGMFSHERLPELKIYTNLLDDESVMPKQKLEEAIKLEEEEQEKIAMLNAQAQLMKQRVGQFLGQDATAQASQINDIVNSQQVPTETVEEAPEEQTNDNQAQ